LTARTWVKINSLLLAICLLRMLMNIEFTLLFRRGQSCFLSCHKTVMISTVFSEK
jgi:hypothetical protein